MRTYLFVFLMMATVCCRMQQTDAFVPNDILNLLGNIANLLDAPTSFIKNLFAGGSHTHKDITREAVLQVARDVLRNNPNPDPDIDSTSRINNLRKLTAKTLINAYYSGSSGDRRNRFEDAIDEISDANEGVDASPHDRKIAAYHFDSEEFEEGQEELVKLRQEVITNVKLEKYKAAREQAGRMLHTLQDFYSHSNWIEMGHRVPYSALGDPSQNLAGITAPLDMPTCTDCTRSQPVLNILR